MIRMCSSRKGGISASSWHSGHGRLRRLAENKKGGCTVNVYRRGEKSALLGQSSKIAVEAEVQRA
jgi:hypothetical protein